MKLVSNKGLTFGNEKHDKINGFEIVDVSEFLKEPEPAPKDYTIVISCADGKTTVAGMLVNGKCVKVTEANLDPRDEFNFRIGAETAFNRLFEKRH